MDVRNIIFNENDSHMILERHASKKLYFECDWAQWDSLIINDGVLKRVWESTDPKEVKDQVILPLSARNEFLSEMHGGVSGDLLE